MSKPFATHGCLFIHIPRTGGNSIHAVTGCWFDHLRARWIKDQIKWSELWTFSIIRNPWDLAVSWWSLCRKKRMIQKPFKEWVVHNDNPWKHKLWINQDPLDQWKYISDNSESDIIVSYVARFERLKEEWPLIQAKMRKGPKTLPRREATRHMHYSSYYDKETKEIIAKRYSNIIKRFSYQFESKP